MIKVEINKKQIYLLSLLFSVLPSEDRHPLGGALIDSLNYSEIREFLTFQKLLSKGIIPSHPYVFAKLSVNINEDLSPKPLLPSSGFGEKTLDLYDSNLYPLALEIYDKSNFQDAFEDILFDLKDIVSDMQKTFRGNIFEVLRDVWKFERDISMVLNPNIFEVSHSYGVFRGKNLYSITSPTKQGEEIVFPSQYLISNSLHEFSHSIFQKRLIDNGLYGKNIEISSKIELPNIAKDKYSGNHNYMEENFIIAIVLTLQEKLYSNFMKEDERKKKSLEKIDFSEKRGFLYVNDFYKKLLENENVIDAYFDVINTYSK